MLFKKIRTALQSGFANYVSVISRAHMIWSEPFSDPASQADIPSSVVDVKRRWDVVRTQGRVEQRGLEEGLVGALEQGHLGRSLELSEPHSLQRTLHPKPHHKKHITKQESVVTTRRT